MSELKATRIKMVYNGQIYDDFGTVPCTQLYYRKDESDAVIARLKESAKNLILDNYLQDKEIRRHKHKRCLAMAEACMHKRWRPDEGFDYARSTRHMNKWLEIAEQFKPNNSTAQ